MFSYYMSNVNKHVYLNHMAIVDFLCCDEQISRSRNFSSVLENMAKPARYALSPGDMTCICTNRAFDRVIANEILSKLCWVIQNKIYCSQNLD